MYHASVAVGYSFPVMGSRIVPDLYHDLDILKCPGTYFHFLGCVPVACQTRLPLRGEVWVSWVFPAGVLFATGTCARSSTAPAPASFFPLAPDSR